MLVMMLILFAECCSSLIVGFVITADVCRIIVESVIRR